MEAPDGRKDREEGNEGRHGGTDPKLALANLGIWLMGTHTSIA